MAPPSDVLRAFGISGSPAVALAGGEGPAWMTGGAVLKPSDNAEEAEWVASVLEGLQDRSDFRVATPLRSAGGHVWVDGWTAARFLEGGHDTSPSSWPTVLRVGRAFHLAIADVPCPQFLADRSHGWAEADRVAWGESNADVTHPPIASLLDALADPMVPTGEHRQVIHGDLSENVLFAPRLAPAVIDFVPYCRPVAFALAIVVVDAVTWHGASADLFSEELADVEDIASFLARALVFRLVAADRSLARRPEGPHLAQLQADAHRRAGHTLGIL